MNLFTLEAVFVVSASELKSVNPSTNHDDVNCLQAKRVDRDFRFVTRGEDPNSIRVARYDGCWLRAIL